MEQKRSLLEPQHPQIPICRQCELLGLSRSSYYYTSCRVPSEDLEIMKKLDTLALEFPFFGSRRMTVSLQNQGIKVNRKRVQRLMRLMGMEAIYPKPKLSQKHPEHRIYPYLLRGLKVERVNQVWSTDITYIPLTGGFLYLVAVIDWSSRYVLSWRLSNTLEVDFCIEALEEALEIAQPEIFNTDQGSQFTSPRFTETLLNRTIQISMDGRGRALDNIFIERLWRSVKYEDIYIRDYQNGEELHRGLEKYFHFYNTFRPHQALKYRTPKGVFEEQILT